MAAVRLASLGIRLGTPWQCGNRTGFPGGRHRIQFAANLDVKVSGGDRGQEFS
jgi:hypothetical protein